MMAETTIAINPEIKISKNLILIVLIIKQEIKVEIPTTNPPIILSLYLKLYLVWQFAQAKVLYPFQKAIKTILDDKGVLHFSHFFILYIFIQY